MKTHETVMSEKNRFLAEIKEKGLPSPAEMHWKRLKEHILKYADNPGDKLLNPLILDASAESHAVSMTAYKTN